MKLIHVPDAAAIQAADIAVKCGVRRPVAIAAALRQLAGMTPADRRAAVAEYIRNMEPEREPSTT